MKILIIDDESIVARSLQKAFQLKGHEVRVADSGLQGLQIWQEFGPERVIVDVVMPGMNGLQVIEEAQASGLVKNCKVVLMSAHSSINSIQEAQRRGADSLERKPFDNIFDVVIRIEKL
ncbi:MAG: response regulator [Oligoflexia bacterium]|nr:response regulator [Oligoflexia bacterium]